MNLLMSDIFWAYITSNKLTNRKESARKSQSFTEEGDGEGNKEREREEGGGRKREN